VKEVKFTLEEAMKVQRGNRDIAVIFLNVGNRWRWVVNSTPQPLNPREKDQVAIVEEGGWDPGTVKMIAENLALIWI
jgi:hypothetical protein